MFPSISFKVLIEGVPKRQIATLQRTAVRMRLEDHRDTILPQHFEANTKTIPGGPYGYLPRSRRYRRRKRRKTGQDIPWVFTGRSKREAKAGAKITATRNRGRIRINVHFPLRPEYRQELQVVTRQERKDHARKFGRDVRRLMRQPEFRRQRRLRTSGTSATPSITIE